MLSRRSPELHPAPHKALPKLESTLPQLVAARRQHSEATPRHAAVIRRADAALQLLDDYQAEGEFIQRGGR